MKLQGIVRAQADIQSRLEEIRERIPLIRQKQRVVTQGAHRYPNLLEVEQVL